MVIDPCELSPSYVRSIAPYQPGKPISELARELGLKEENIIKLASNENPLGPSPKAVEAMQRGAFGYLTKPFDDKELKATIEKALSQQRMSREIKRLKSLVKELYGLENVVARSPAMQRLFQQVAQVADSDANFVLFGRFADRHAVWQGLVDRGVLIRETGPDGWLRVSIGTPDENSAFLAAQELAASLAQAVSAAEAPLDTVLCGEAQVLERRVEQHRCRVEREQPERLDVAVERDLVRHEVVAHGADELGVLVDVGVVPGPEVVRLPGRQRLGGPVGVADRRPALSIPGDRGRGHGRRAPVPRSRRRSENPCAGRYGSDVVPCHRPPRPCAPH